jgi:apolipoprotein N-acyltransferase
VGFGARFRERLREVGESYLALWRAEVAAILDALGRSGKALVRALVLVAIAAAIGFWTLGLLLYFAVELLALVLPRWGAVGVVLALFVVLTAVLLLVARGSLKRVESPATTVRRRLEDHRRWWQERVADESEALAADAVSLEEEP